MADTIEDDVKELEQNGEVQDTNPNTEETKQEQGNENNPVVVVENNNSGETAEPKHFDGFRGRLAEKYKDCGEDFGDDAVFEKYCNKACDDYENELKGYHECDDKMREVFGVWPEFKDMIQDIAVHHVAPRVAIARQFSVEDLTPNSDDEDYTDWGKAFAERKEKEAKQKAFEEELYKNMGESNGVIDKFCTEKSLDEDQKKKLIETMNGCLDDAFNGKVSDVMLDAFYKALNYAKAVEMAKAVGEISGRNANIEAKMEGDSKKVKGDGLPNPSSSSYKPNMVRGSKSVINMDAILNRR